MTFLPDGFWSVQVEQIIDAIQAVDVIKSDSVEYYRTLENATYPQLPQTLYVKMYNEISRGPDVQSGNEYLDDITYELGLCIFFCISSCCHALLAM